MNLQKGLLMVILLLPSVLLLNKTASTLSLNSSSYSLKKYARFDNNFHYKPKIEYLGSQNTSHDPIYIDGNNDLRSQSSYENWKGSGTKNDPFIISNYSIQGAPGSSLIYIKNTDLFCQITDNQIYGGQRGIVIVSSHNILISRNYIFNMSVPDTHLNAGIALWDGSTNIIILANIIQECGHGIDLGLVTNNSIIGNFLYNNRGSGIECHGGDFNIILNNTIDGHSNGIYLGHGSDSNKIVNNTIINSYHFGYPRAHYNYTIKGGNGIKIYTGSDQNIVVGNIIANSFSYGILLDTVENTIIQNNDFLHNNLNGNSQARVKDGLNNSFSNNFWNDWNNSDTETSGFSDILSRNRPHLKSQSIEYLCFPCIVAPNIGQEINDILHVRWNPPCNGENKTVWYNISYCLGNPYCRQVDWNIYSIEYDWQNWNLLKSFLTQTEFICNLTDMSALIPTSVRCPDSEKIDFDPFFIIKVRAFTADGLWSEDWSGIIFTKNSPFESRNLLSVYFLEIIIGVSVIYSLISIKRNFCGKKEKNHYRNNTCN